jgi:hypothetical protein
MKELLLLEIESLERIVPGEELDDCGC